MTFVLAEYGFDVSVLVMDDEIVSLGLVSGPVDLLGIIGTFGQPIGDLNGVLGGFVLGVCQYVKGYCAEGYRRDGDSDQGGNFPE